MTNLPPNQAAGHESAQTIQEYNALFGQLMGLADCIDGHYRASLVTHESDFKKAYEQ